MRIEAAFLAECRTNWWWWFCTTTCIAANRHLLCRRVTSEANAKNCKCDRKVISNIVEILLGVEKLVVGRDSIMANELIQCQFLACSQELRTHTW